MNTETMSNFASCEICGESDWTLAYCGPVRDGAFGSVRENALVGRCGCCGVERLAEEVCIPPSFYETDAYRSKLQQELDSESYFSTHDELQIHTLKSIWPANLRGKTIAEIGCAAGSLLDHLRGYTRNQIAIEPYDAYREGLRSPSGRFCTAWGNGQNAGRDVVPSGCMPGARTAGRRRFCQ
jgi:hypothetical protein